MPDLYLDLHFRGMVKFAMESEDASHFRGIERVCHEYARRLPEIYDDGEVIQFGSKLPSVTRHSYGLAKVGNIRAPGELTPAERILQFFNRLERRVSRSMERDYKSVRIFCAIGRRLGISLAERHFFLPQRPRKGDLWLTFSNTFSPAIRQFPTQRVILCHDLNQIFHFKELGFSKPNLKPHDNHCFDVRHDEWVICISEYTRSCFLKFHSGFPSERVFVVPNGSDFPMAITQGDPAEELSRYGVEKGRYFISLAAGTPVKNTVCIIREFLQWHSSQPETSEIRLLLVGAGQSGLLDTMDPYCLGGVRKGAVVFAGYVADASLPSLYSNSIAFLFASLAEGFGLPPLEAMRFGAPVICSDKTSLPEVVGDAGLLFDPLVPGQLSQRIGELFGNENLRADLISRGRRRAAQYTWDKAARSLVAVLKKISAAASAAPPD